MVNHTDRLLASRPAARPAARARLANVIIPGAQKSGTTTLCRFLEAHPDCAVSEPKETNFFSREGNLRNPRIYDACFRHVTPAHRVIADGTTTYMADPRIPSRIKSVLGGDLKFIFTLRAPVGRTYSGYLHMLKRGHERRGVEEVFSAMPEEPSAAIAAECAGVEAAVAAGKLVVWPYLRRYDDVLWNFRYAGNSFYSRQIAEYAAAFGRERILIVMFEDMVAQPGVVAQQLGAFLGVDAAKFPGRFSHGNATRLPDVSTLGGRLLEQARRVKRGHFTLVRQFEADAPLKPPLAIREKLQRVFASERDYWSDYLGRDLRQIGW